MEIIARIIIPYAMAGFADMRERGFLVPIKVGSAGMCIIKMIYE